MAVMTSPARVRDAVPGPASTPPSRRLMRSRRRAGLLMVAPALLHALIWIGIPLVAAVVLSFTSYDVLTPPRC